MNDENLVLVDGDGDVAVTIDLPPEGGPVRHGTVLLVPPYATTARELFAASYGLTVNGFRVIRLDLRGHVGRSTGRIGEFRLSRVVDDLALVLAKMGADVVVAFSLSARPALRLLPAWPGVAGILVTPVVDVRHTLREVTGQDCIADPPEGLQVFGHWAHRDVVLDMRAHDFRELPDALADVATVTSPLSLIAGDQDPWVAIDDVRAVARAHPGPTRLVVVPAGTHELNRHPTVAARYLEALVVEALRIVGSDDTPVVPTLHELIAVSARSRRR
jgi:pimeloyl-ACP methyl ester carboxylesterase